MKKNKIIKKSGMALSQIFILVIGIVAFSYLAGMEFGVVSANVPGSGCDDSDIQVSGSSVSFTYGNRIYTMISDTKITREDGYYYTKDNGVWTYHNPSGGTGIVNSGTEGSYISQWNRVTQNSVQCYEEKSSATSSETADCNSACISRGYVGGVCQTSCGTSKVDIGEQGCEDINEYLTRACCCSKESQTSTDKTEISDSDLPTILSDTANTLQSFIKDSGGEDEGTPEGDGTETPADGSDSESPSAPFGWGEKWKKPGWGYFLGHFVQGLLWAGAVVGLIQTVKSFLPESWQPYLNAASWALGAGIVAGKTVSGIVAGAGGTKKAALWSGVGVGVAVGVIVFFLALKKTSQEIITFSCSPWEAATGGERCEECNKQGADIPCSEYQCRSLGQACELINKGTDDEKCAWINRGDVNFPTIEPSEEALLSDDYEYELQTTGISPPDTGVKVEYTPSTTGCVEAFTPLSFGVNLNEPAKCKIDTSRKESFDEMNFYFSNGLSLYNHTYILSLPGSANLESENITVENGGEYELYVRCQDPNGNYNPANFVFQFCVEEGPDTTAPLIVTTDPLTDKPFAYNQTSINSIIYINEPVNGCKWSHVDQTYDDMDDETMMDCTNADSLIDMNSQGLYSCIAELTGLKDRVENYFYLRCEDQAGNANVESYEYTLIGTQPLVIDYVTPEEGDLIKDSTDSVKVTLEVQTSAGYNEGEANCYYSDTGETSDYVMFFNTGSYQHTQDLWLIESNYNYSIKCCDLGNNCDYAATNEFYVESDSSPPAIVRAYHEETYLKLITSEPARCVYDTTYESYPCDYSFEDGTSMTVVDDINHYTDWNTQTTLYVKCEDEYGTQPDPDECSIIVRPSDIL